MTAVPDAKFQALVDAVAAEALVEPGPDHVVAEVAIANAARALVQAVLEQGHDHGGA